MMFIKNHTPYIGKLKLKFEKEPYYTTGGMTDVLNKVHINLGFTKLVSRMIPERIVLNIKDPEFGISNSPKVDPEKVKLINKYTGGTIIDYSWLSGKDVYTLPDSFVAENSTGGVVYLGDIREAWGFYKNKLVVYTKGVAIKPRDYETQNMDSNKKLTFLFDEVEAIFGYTHRGGAYFKIGDKVFDGAWVPQNEELLENEIYYVKHLHKIKDDEDLGEFAVQYIPFNKRGSKTITNWSEAIEGASNLAKYL